MLAVLHRDVVRAKTIEASVDRGAILPLVDSKYETFDLAGKLVEFLDEYVSLKNRLSGDTVAQALTKRFAEMQSKRATGPAAHRRLRQGRLSQGRCQPGRSEGYRRRNRVHPGQSTVGRSLARYRHPAGQRPGQANPRLDWRANLPSRCRRAQDCRRAAGGVPGSGARHHDSVDGTGPR